MVLLLAILTIVQPTAGAQSLRIGLAAGASNVRCLSMPGDRLAPGATVTLIALSDPQRVSRAIVLGDADICGMLTEQEMPRPYYALGPEEQSESLPELAVAVAGRPGALAVDGRIRLHLRADIAEAQVRSCTSAEGLHLTVWSGVPLKSKRLWHAYWFLGFDVEPNCEAGDYAGGGNQR